jgi:hypothetical protein
MAFPHRLVLVIVTDHSSELVLGLYMGIMNMALSVIVYIVLLLEPH